MSRSLCTGGALARSYTLKPPRIAAKLVTKLVRKTMRNVRVLVRNAAIVTALSAALSACVVYPARGYYVAGPAVTIAPPAPRVEVYGVAPAPGYVWVGGYWNWVGGTHVWVGGHWVAPRAGYRWEPHHWVHERDGWHLHEGYWVRR